MVIARAQVLQPSCRSSALHLIHLLATLAQRQTRLVQTAASLRCSPTPRSKAHSVEHAVPSPVAGHAVHALLVYAHRSSRQVLARSPSRDLTRHGCRARAYKDVLAACPARVGGQGPRSKLTASKARRGHRTGCGCFVEHHAHRPSRQILARSPSRDLARHGCRVRSYKDLLAACPAMVGGQGPCSKLTASRTRRGHRTGCGSFVEPCTPIISTGPCPLTLAGPYAAWMPRKSLQGRTCGVSRDGGRARTLQPGHLLTAPSRRPDCQSPHRALRAICAPLAAGRTRPGSCPMPPADRHRIPRWSRMQTPACAPRQR
ncbi:hypothetical protein CFBP6600_14550 [Xanthomonas arboricola pv. corylina]|nr:hypothetical protein CFBP6600_14550 [Xanthomonas arboricola pv. corylina]CAE6742333.1 hypothetical protein CFBP6600_14550 [Xanthomonas arboricola pv. corylina]CAE6742434.1 hypothetical protein XAC301_14670 [Xanthomonas arboricola pv. corylina]CAE6742459.1 hypothetical protein XAC301_14670 [Xanthomonas arboricola pv. corylina]